MNNNVAVQLIIVIGGIITTLITVKYKDRIAEKLRKGQSPDRIEFIYEGYEGLIRGLKTQLDEALKVNEKQHAELLEARNQVETLHGQLREAQRVNQELMHKLASSESA